MASKCTDSPSPTKGTMPTNTGIADNLAEQGIGTRDTALLVATKPC